MSYIFDQNDLDSELARLRGIESALDPHSQHMLGRTGVAEGWNCLEVGAGAGSIAQWLTSRVGPMGHVVANDKKATYLRPLQSPTCEVIEGDVGAIDRPGEFDLIHCRYVLVHNRGVSEMLAHFRTLLKPGGFLVLQEPDFESAQWIDDAYRSAGGSVNAAIRAMFFGNGLDPGLGKRLPWILSRHGFSVKQVVAMSHIEHGMEPVAAMMAASAGALRSQYVATGQASGQDVDRYIVGARDHASWALYYTTVSVVAKQRRPSTTDAS